MKLFIKLIMIAIHHRKYINWKKVNQEFALTLSTTMMFHPEEEPFKKWLGHKDVVTLISDN
jgi:hypothetical protein